MSAEAEGGAPRRRFLPKAGWLVWLFAAIGLFGLIALIALLAMVLDLSRPYQPAKVAVAGGEAGKETVLTLGSAEDVPGTNLLAFDVRDGVGGPSSMSVRGGDDRRNLLLVDKETGASRKLLPDNLHRLYDSRFLPARAEAAAGADRNGDGTGDEASDQAPAAYYLLEVGEKARPELRDVVVGVLATGRAAVVMRGLDGVDRVWMAGPTRIGLVVRERLGLYYRIVDTGTLQVVRSQRIALD